MPSLIRWVEDLITETSRFAVSRDLPDYCDLNTVLRLTDDDRTRHPALNAPYVLVNDDGDYCSVYAVAGSFVTPTKRHPWRPLIPGPAAWSA